MAWGEREGFQYTDRNEVGERALPEDFVST